MGNDNAKPKENIKAEPENDKKNDSEKKTKENNEDLVEEKESAESKRSSTTDDSALKLVQEICHQFFLYQNKHGYFALSAPAHDGVRCVFCKSKNFITDRYKCLICDDYDLCGTCFEERKFNESHLKEHPMIRYSAPNEVFSESVVGKRLDYEMIKEMFKDSKHEGTVCQACGTSPICGVRLKCDECLNFDLCRSCFEEKVEKKKHKRDHYTLVCDCLQNMNAKDIELKDQLGKGAFGTVYKAKWIPKNKIVACKVIEYNMFHMINGLSLNNIMESFIREITAYNELNCSYIIKTYGSFTDIKNEMKTCYLLTEYMEKGSLTSLIENDKTLSLRCRLTMACNIASGIRRIHEKKFIHRDIRPDNIFVNKHFIAKIGDMGLAKVHDSCFQATTLGCRNYMPKEFFTGTYSEKLDVFTFGLTLYYLFTGVEHLSNGRGVIRLGTKAVVFREIISSCLADDPSDRPTSAQLENILNLYHRVLMSVISKTNNYVFLSNEDRRNIFIQVYETTTEQLKKLKKMS